MFRLSFFCALVTSAASAAPRIRPIVPMLDGRIVGGEETTIEERPYQLSMQYYGSHFCGASIISDTRALTAAHCTSRVTPGAYSVRAGSTRRGSGGQVVEVVEIHSHPNYDPEVIDFDVAILILKTPLAFGKGVQPIALHKEGEEVPEGAIASVSGWGTTSSGGSSPLRLRVVDVPRVDDLNCQKAYKNIPITERMICFGSSTGGKDSCQGDSGGPIVFNGEQVGIVSWGYGCAHPDYPGVYTKVSNSDINNHIIELLN